VRWKGPASKKIGHFFGRGETSALRRVVVKREAATPYDGAHTGIEAFNQLSGIVLLRSWTSFKFEIDFSE
jgi:hypothetical protein